MPKHRRHGPPASRWHGQGVHQRLRAFDAGIVPAGVYFRPRPAVRRGASRFLARLAQQAPLIAAADQSIQPVKVDLDDTIIQVHGYSKQGSGYGYSGVRGLNALLAVVSTKDTAPVIVGQRLRKGSCGSPRGAKRLQSARRRTSSRAWGSVVAHRIRHRVTYGVPAIRSGGLLLTPSCRRPFPPWV